MKNFGLPPSYMARMNPVYHADDPDPRGRVWQPEVYTLAGALAKMTGRVVVDIGCGNGRKLAQIASDYTVAVIGLDYGSNVDLAREVLQTAVRVCDLTNVTPNTFPVEDWVLKDAVVVCADVIEHLVNPVPLLGLLKHLYELGSVILISTPDRGLVPGPAMGPPLNRAHVREWTSGEFRDLLRVHEIEPEFVGLTVEDNRTSKATTILAICWRGRR